MKKAKNEFLILAIVLILGLNSFFYVNRLNQEDIVIRKLKALNLKEIDKVMIVAHPDDELLWGGNHLIEDTYLVVCVTCGEDEIRQREFARAMKEVDCPYISLGYPDRNTWDSHEKYIKEDLDTIFNYKKFNYIVTHNPDGDYGHSQHIKLSKYVTFIANHDNLYYFDKYYSTEELNDMNYCMKGLSKEQLEKKLKVLEIYVTQEAIVNLHKQTTPYEEFIPYEDWFSEKEKEIIE